MTSPLPPSQPPATPNHPVTAVPVTAAEGGAGEFSPAPPSGGAYPGPPPPVGQPHQVPAWHGQAQGQQWQAQGPQHIQPLPGYHQQQGQQPFGQPAGVQQAAPWQFAEQSASSAARTITPTRKKAAWVTVGGAALVLIGSFLPWASVAFVGSIYGTDGDGILTIICALVAAGLALPIALGKGRGWMLGVALFFGLVAAAIAAYDLSNISGLAADESFVSVGPGLPVVIAGGLVVVGGAVWGLTARSRR